MLVLNYVYIQTYNHQHVVKTSGTLHLSKISNITL